MDEAHWAAQMMEYLQEEDSESWLVASEPAGDPVGMVAVSTFDPGVATVTFIGVVPEHRGHGYGHDLLQAGEHSTAELADLFGVARSTVYRAQHRHQAAARP
jgi:ribosomal protein S18 acetylase RimI-like enzyme